MLKAAFHGGVAEWLKAAVLKTVRRKPRGFESYPLRHSLQSEFRVSGLGFRVDPQLETRNPKRVSRRGDRVAEGARLLSESVPKGAARVQIPASPPYSS